MFAIASFGNVFAAELRTLCLPMPCHRRITTVQEVRCTPRQGEMREPIYQVRRLRLQASGLRAGSRAETIFDGNHKFFNSLSPLRRLEIRYETLFSQPSAPLERRLTFANTIGASAVLGNNPGSICCVGLPSFGTSLVAESNSTGLPHMSECMAMRPPMSPPRELQDGGQMGVKVVRYPSLLNE